MTAKHVKKPPLTDAERHDRFKDMAAWRRPVLR